MGRSLTLLANPSSKGRSQPNDVPMACGCGKSQRPLCTLARTMVPVGTQVGLASSTQHRQGDGPASSLRRVTQSPVRLRLGVLERIVDQHGGVG